MRVALRAEWAIVSVLAASAACSAPSSSGSAPSGGPEAVGAVSQRAQATGFTVADVHGRTINTAGVTLVDWEGQIANPAIHLSVTPPPGATFPCTATVSANGVRLYFEDDGPQGGPQAADGFGPNGPSITVTFASASDVHSVFMSIFGDRDGVNESYSLTLSGGGFTTIVPVQVIDQDINVPPVFHVKVDFSQDKLCFYTDCADAGTAPAAHRAVVQQAVDDWAYFIGDMSLDPVGVGNEMTFIWNPDGFHSGSNVANTIGYTGFLVYAYGIHDPTQLRSGGEGSAFDFQTSNGVSLMLSRSGGQEIETAGNFNTLGWIANTDENLWYVSGNLTNEQNDLFSVVHHEVGHTMGFSNSYTKWFNFAHDEADAGPADASVQGVVNDPAVIAYHGHAPPINEMNHLCSGTCSSGQGEIDDASRIGAFGSEYLGKMPARRWQITKLDLLVKQAIGYKLRPTSAFAVLANTTSALPGGQVASAYSATLQASGGVPAYDWTLTSGALPPGLTLDSFSGAISGTPAASGTFSFTVLLRDGLSDQGGVATQLSIAIQSAPADAGGPDAAAADAAPVDAAAADAAPVDAAAADASTTDAGGGRDAGSDGSIDAGAGCTLATAIDLGGPGTDVTVANNACVRVLNGYPTWWGTRVMQLQDTSPGAYPAPFTWSNTCSGSAGSGTFTGDFQSQNLASTSSACGTLIHLMGSGAGSITLRYFG